MEESRKIWQAVFEKTEAITVEKGQILMSAGEMCKNAYFVDTGCLKSYVIDSQGKEHIVQFAPEGHVIGEMNSVVNKVPTVLYVQAIENSVVKLINVDLVIDLPSHEVEFLESHIKVLRNNIISLNKRIIHLLSSTAEERYLDFLNNYSGLSQRLTQKQIASYLGITPESLSRIRSRISTEEKK